MADLSSLLRALFGRDETADAADRNKYSSRMSQNVDRIGQPGLPTFSEAVRQRQDYELDPVEDISPSEWRPPVLMRSLFSKPRLYHPDHRDAVGYLLDDYLSRMSR